jgi:hypothetical protein
MYKVTGSSRNRPDERRIEITTTYAGQDPGSPTCGDYEDVVLGYDADSNTFVGFDHRRLYEGGDTHNASSFFDGSALRIPPDGLEVVPFKSTLLGMEYHVYFAGNRAADYLLNARQIHGTGVLAAMPGTYRKPPHSSRSLSVSNQRAGGENVHLEALAATATAPRFSNNVELVESGRPTRRLTPHGLDAVLARCQENGRLGEQFVLGEERRRLRALGCPELADRTEWVSLVNVAAGFDLRVPDEDGGSDHLVEVKATQGSSMTFPMSDGEWTVAEETGDRYWIARVVRVRSEEPEIVWLNDPLRMEREGILTRSWDGFRVAVSLL